MINKIYIKYNCVNLIYMELYFDFNMLLNIDDFNKNNIIFNEPIKNSIIINSNFIKIVYADEIIVFNGIFLVVY